MGPEVAHVSAIAALMLSAALAVIGILGGHRNDHVLLALARSLTVGQWVFALLAFVLLCVAFVTDDFSVAYVAENSNTALPTHYKVSAVWGAHEGSFLVWILVMASWMLAVAVRGRHLPADFLGPVLGVLGLLQTGFLAFLLFTSNPFERLLPLAPAEGADLNPLLQDLGLILHPPILYAGYVGFSVAFAFAVAALLTGRLDAAWARWSRPWTNIAWAFLTLGIALGSWWAYYELGWGGWWFWDPVENASFMPWLAGTALLHSLAVTEKRGTFKSWTLLLALMAFSLSLLGAFIVRSGVLTSVHAFAVDPTRGLFILGFLVLVVGGALLLYALRASQVHSTVRYGLLSREAFMLINNLLLLVALAAVLYGTLHPLIYEAVTGGQKSSVGAPYFDAVFVPLMVLLAVALGVQPVLRWKDTAVARLLRTLRWLALGSVLSGLLLPWLLSGTLRWQVALTIALGFWIAGAQLKDWWRLGWRGSRLAYRGMALAHLGFAAALVGVGLTSQLSVERDLRFEPGTEHPVGAYRFRFLGSEAVAGPNYLADRGRFEVRGASGDVLAVLLPEKRRYPARNSIMTEAAINASVFRDLYVSLGEPLDADTDAWAVRVQVKPMVRWIWGGALLMALGGVLAVLDVRYRRLRHSLSAPRGERPSGAALAQLGGRTEATS